MQCACKDPSFDVYLFCFDWKISKGVATNQLHQDHWTQHTESCITLVDNIAPLSVNMALTIGFPFSSSLSLSCFYFRCLFIPPSWSSMIDTAIVTLLNVLLYFEVMFGKQEKMDRRKFTHFIQVSFVHTACIKPKSFHMKLFVNCSAQNNFGVESQIIAERIFVFFNTNSTFNKVLKDKIYYYPSWRTPHKSICPMAVWKKQFMYFILGSSVFAIQICLNPFHKTL